MRKSSWTRLFAAAIGIGLLLPAIAAPQSAEAGWLDDFAHGRGFPHREVRRSIDRSIDDAIHRAGVRREHMELNGVYYSGSAMKTKYNKADPIAERSFEIYEPALVRFHAARYGKASILHFVYDEDGNKLFGTIDPGDGKTDSCEYILGRGRYVLKTVFHGGSSVGKSADYRIKGEAEYLGVDRTQDCNRPYNAQEIRLGEEVRNIFQTKSGTTTDDAQYYFLRVERPQNVTLTTKRLVPVGDCILRFLDGEEREIMRCSIAGDQVEGYKMFLDAGLYYVRMDRYVEREAAYSFKISPAY